MAYKLLGIDLKELVREQVRYDLVKAYIESGHRDWNNGWHSDGWAQAQNDKAFEKVYRKVEEVKLGKRASNLDLALETVKVKKAIKLGMYTDGGTYSDIDSGYWAVYSEY